MRIRLIEVAAAGDEGEHYRFQADLDVANADEAYVKAREFAKLTWSLSRGLREQNAEEMAEYRAAEERTEEESDDP